MAQTKKENKEGFTLIEILVVVALIAILATITFIAINPARNFQETRDTQRSTHVNTILNAVSQYLTVQGNSLGTLATATSTHTPGVTVFPTCAGTDPETAGDPVGTGADSFDLATVLSPTYVVDMPNDPQAATPDVDTGYRICQNAAGNRVTIWSATVEGGGSIQVSR